MLQFLQAMLDTNFDNVKLHEMRKDILSKLLFHKSSRTITDGQILHDSFVQMQVFKTFEQIRIRPTISTF